MKKTTALLLCSALLLAGCGAPTPANSSGPKATTGGHFVLDSTRTYLQGQVVVGLQAGVKAQDIADLLGGQVLRDVPRLSSAVIALPAGLSLHKAVLRLQGSGLARYAEPNYLQSHPATSESAGAGTLNAQAVMNDPEIGFQWFLRNMGVPTAWDTATGKGIRIGIADEDMDRHHPDLAANVVYPGYDAPNDELITSKTVLDDTGEHATWVAGTAAAVGNNGLGGAGVAPQASIVPLTITHDPAGASNVDSAMAFLFAVDGPDGKGPSEAGDTDTPAGHKGYVDILNYSFGGSTYSQFSKEAIDYVLMNGVIFVTSAGNTPTTGSGNPAWVPGVISVAATTPNNIRSTFSNMGSHLSVAAPGTNIWVTARRTDPTDAKENNYEFVDGTSFASPATAGVAALILQAAAEKNADGSIKKINLTPAQVRHILEDTAYKPSGAYDTNLGNGIVRADAAVKRATQDAANTVEKGASVSMKFVAADDPTVGIPLMGVTMVGGTRRPTQMLYAQSASGDVVFSAGYTTFREIDAGLYKLYASGPRTILTNVTAGSSVQTVNLKPGDRINFGNQAGVFPVTVALPVDSTEPNDTPDKADPIAYGQAYSAVMSLDDVDYFKFEGKAGEVAFINTQAVTGGADLQVTVLDASGKKLASNDDFRDKTTDAALLFKVPADGSYTIKVDGVNTGNAFNTYWVALTKDNGKETEPNGSGTVADDVFSGLDFSKANALPIGSSLAATLDTNTDIDIYSFEGSKGDSILADINTSVGGSPDTILALFDSSGKLLTSNDDTKTQDSTLNGYALPADGKYYLAVAAYTSSSQKSKGDYRISLAKY